LKKIISDTNLWTRLNDKNRSDNRCKNVKPLTEYEQQSKIFVKIPYPLSVEPSLYSPIHLLGEEKTN
jgi:hypothetical protein